LDQRASKVFRDECASDFGYFGEKAEFFGIHGLILTFLGPSSNHAFFRAVSCSFAQVLRTSASSRDQNQTLSTTTTTTTVHDRQQADAPMTGQAQALRGSSQFALPSITEGRQLIDYFFATAGSNFPFITKSDLTTTLKEIYSAHSTYQSSLKRAFMDIVFAHACSAIGNPRGDWHYRRSMKNLTPAKLGGADVRSSKCIISLEDFHHS
jgi:hypothetical protein